MKNKNLIVESASWSLRASNEEIEQKFNGAIKAVNERVKHAQVK